MSINAVCRRTSNPCRQHLSIHIVLYGYNKTPYPLLAFVYYIQRTPLSPSNKVTSIHLPSSMCLHSPCPRYHKASYTIMNRIHPRHASMRAYSHRNHNDPRIDPRYLSPFDRPQRNDPFQQRNHDDYSHGPYQQTTVVNACRCSSNAVILTGGHLRRTCDVTRAAGQLANGIIDCCDCRDCNYAEFDHCDCNDVFIDDGGCCHGRRSHCRHSHLGGLCRRGDYHANCQPYRGACGFRHGGCGWRAAWDGYQHGCRL